MDDADEKTKETPCKRFVQAATDDEFESLSSQKIVQVKKDENYCFVLH